MYKLHKSGTRANLLTAAIMAVSVATLARWDSLQNVALGHIALETLLVHPGVHGISLILSHLKGHHNDKYVNKTGWLRHRYLLECPTFHLALHLWIV
jgi:hypothetical protein